MPIPDYQSFFLPVLRALSDDLAYSSADLRGKLIATLGLSPEQLHEKLPSGRQSVFANRVAWSTFYLAKAGALRRPKRGTSLITERGHKLLQEHPNGFTVRTLTQFPEFVAFYKPTGSTPDSKAEVQTDSSETPEEQLANAYQVLREALANDVLEAVRKSPPAFMETLVVDLLVAMGYGGSVADAGRAVGQSGDGGVDGVIKEDKLGLDLVYIQAKRWKESIGRPQVQGFAGSLEGFRARKGVFITTSTFTTEARTYVQNIEKKIVLIDGKQLADLMIEHNVGVAATRTITLKRLDSDYFEAD